MVNIVLQEKDEVLFLPSLLTPNLIKTQLLQDEYYINEAGEMTLVAEWNSLAYLRKSLMEEMNLDIETTGFSSENADKSSAVIQEDKKMKRYYEYSIYDYCSLPEDEAKNLTPPNVVHREPSGREKRPRNRGTHLR